MAVVLAVFFQIIDVTPGTRIPLADISFVDAVNLASRRCRDIFMRQEEFAETRIERKSMHTMAGRVNHHRA